jgi:2-dehydropantoate 2-reductase
VYGGRRSGATGRRAGARKMKILVMGAGAVGGFFGARLIAAGEEVVFCERGLELESIRGDVNVHPAVTGDPREFAPYDLILFCVKAYDTDAAAEAIKGCLAPGGAVLTLQNGVENEARLAEILGHDAVMGGNARVGAELVAPGRIVHLSSGHIDFGELDGRDTERARSIAAAFQRAGILGECTSRIRSLRWDKLVWNGAFNTVATLTRRRVGEILDDPEALRLVCTLMREIIDVARADGADLGYDRIDFYLAHSRKNLRALKTSTQQDLERGRRLEYEALAGAVVRAARRHGVAAPAMETIYALIRLLAAGASTEGRG